jgi:hypothetical protein
MAFSGSQRGNFHEFTIRNTCSPLFIEQILVVVVAKEKSLFVVVAFLHFNPSPSPTPRIAMRWRGEIWFMKRVDILHIPVFICAIVCFPIGAPIMFAVSGGNGNKSDRFGRDSLVNCALSPPPHVFLLAGRVG